jgi:hypothetical protein
MSLREVRTPIVNRSVPFSDLRRASDQKLVYCGGDEQYPDDQVIDGRLEHDRILAKGAQRAPLRTGSEMSYRLHATITWESPREAGEIPVNQK